MSFNALPLELVDNILSYVVPRHWNTRGKYDEYGDSLIYWIPTGHDLLVLRLVCRQFCAIISRELLRKADSAPLSQDMQRMNVDGLTAVFMAKNSLDPMHPKRPLVFAAISTNVFCNWKEARNKRPEKALYFRAACKTLLANKGSEWAFGKIVEGQYELRSSAESLLPASAKPKGRDLVLQVLEQGCLAISASLGDLSTIKALLRHGADLNKPHDQYGYPLYAAACSGQVNTMRLLVDSGADVSLAKGAFGNPLEVAARHGHLEAVQYLAEKNVATGYALGDALFGGHEDVADYLLNNVRGVDVNAARRKDEVPVWLAIRYGYRYIALQLCKHADLDPNAAGPDKKTPLFFAVYNEWNDVAEALLSYPTIEADKVSKDCETPLHRASLDANDDIVRLLLARDDVDVNSFNGAPGQTALINAMLWGSRSTVMLLLEHPATEAFIGAHRESPLEIAVDEDDTEMIEILLKRPEVLGCGANGEYALTIAIEKGHLPYVKRLLDAYPADTIGFCHYIDHDDPVFYTCTSHASQLMSDDASPAHPNKFVCCRDTFLLCTAAERGHVEIVQCLLSRRGINVNAMGHEGPPLYCAIESEQVEVVRFLLEWPARAVDVNVIMQGRGVPTKFFQRRAPSSRKRAQLYAWKMGVVARYSRTTLLTAALKCRSNAILKLLLGHRRIDPNITIDLGRTALFQAVLDHDGTCAGAVELLLAHRATDPNIADQCGWTPLLVAVQENRIDFVKALLQHPDIDPNRRNNSGWTPLLLAMKYKHAEVVRELLLHPRTETNVFDNGKMPLGLT